MISLSTRTPSESKMMSSGLAQVILAMLQAHGSLELPAISGSVDGDHTGLIESGRVLINSMSTRPGSA
jgi:hypothetical protein